MENLKVKCNVGLLKICLNDEGEYTVISTDDDTFFERFSDGYKRVMEKAENLDAKYAEIDKKYAESDIDRIVEKTRAKREFSESAAQIIDSIFGKDTVKKHFSDIYNEIPDFVPSAECMLSFLEQVTPGIEKLFNKTISERDKASKERMAKYQPQDHKKPVKNK